MKATDVIPVTVLTGYLGAGKTTLLNHLLSQKHGYRCAIIINEFGAISIDHQLIVRADEEIMELNNGCLCCRVRGDLVRSLGDLLARQKRFDYVLIETTGLAEPGPVAQTFRATALAERMRLDGIVTVVDSLHLEKELNDGPEARAQVAFADVILLNKSDLVPPDQHHQLEARIRKMNPLAKIHRTERSQIDFGKLLNIRARGFEADFTLPAASSSATPPPSKGEHHHAEEHGHTHEKKDAEAHEPGDPAEEEHAHEHQHDDVTSFFLTEERPLDRAKVEAWMSELIQERGSSLYRTKGVLQIQGVPKRVIFQGVQTTFDAQPDRFWNPGERRLSQMVFIGKELDEAKIRADFAQCVAG